MLNISVRSRLIALVLGMAALLLLVGGLGFHASSSAVNELKEIGSKPFPVEIDFSTYMTCGGTTARH